MPERLAVLATSDELAAITHPTRLRVLDALRSPDSAASVARRLGEPRQRINHHVRELAKAGLLVDAGEVSLQELVEVGERVQRDAAALLDRAAFGGEKVPSAAVAATVRFADAESRAAFLDDYLALTASLIERHAAREGEAYTVALVTYPETEGAA
jgi:DNA-binding transcriptional ArsR family regulator